MFTIQTLKTDQSIKTIHRKLIAKRQVLSAARLGQGFFATAYAHPNPNLIVKISIADRRFIACDDPMQRDGYANWLRAMATRSSRFFPTVHSATFIINPKRIDQGGIIVAVLEKLTDNEKVSADHRALAGMIDPALFDVRALDSDLTRKRLLSSQNSDTRALSAALNEASKVSNMDLHRHNWMVRVNDGECCPVITDPVA